MKMRAIFIMNEKRKQEDFLNNIDDYVDKNCN